jgi:hypothetical protein
MVKSTPGKIRFISNKATFIATERTSYVYKKEYSSEQIKSDGVYNQESSFNP